MGSLDALIDDYLRAIIQARPWTKRREEEALTRFAEWAHAQGGAARLPGCGKRLLRSARHERSGAAAGGRPEG